MKNDSIRRPGQDVVIAHLKTGGAVYSDPPPWRSPVQQDMTQRKCNSTTSTPTMKADRPAQNAPDFIATLER